MTGEAARLEKIRDQLAAIAPGDWSLVADGEGTMLDARGDHGELNPILRFHRSATSDEIEFILSAPENLRFLIGLVDRAIKAMKPRASVTKSVAARGKEKDFAAEAAMKCQEPAFKAFLEERHGLERPLTDDRAAQKLRSLLGITTRKTLNEDGAAADRWKRLRGDFEQWRKAG